MAAFNVPPTNQNERNLERARRMEEKIAKIYATRKTAGDNKKNEDQIASNNRNNSPTHPNKTTTPATTIRQNSIAIFICDLSNVTAAIAEPQQPSITEPSIEWLEHKNFGVAENSPERLIMSTLVKGNGELIMFGGLQKESMNVNEDINISNSLYYLTVPTEII
jgi:F-box protein 42